MDYEPFRVEYTAGQPYVGATLSMFPAPNSHGGMGNVIVWNPTQGKIEWSILEKVWAGTLTTSTGVGFYATLDARLKAVDVKSGKILGHLQSFHLHLSVTSIAGSIVVSSTSVS